MAAGRKAAAKGRFSIVLIVSIRAGRLSRALTSPFTFYIAAFNDSVSKVQIIDPDDHPLFIHAEMAAKFP
jgi:hypothetical protein